MHTILPLTAALTLALGLGAASPARAQSGTELPDIGSSAGEVLAPGQEQQYGAMTLRELRRLNLLLDDPLVDAWMQSMGYRLVAASDRPRQPFTFFMLRDRQINAFATLGGYIGMNSGLVLTAATEDEVAAVLAHEIAHVTQRHVLRAVERAQKDALPIALAMVGAIVAAQQAGGNSSGEATQAAIIGGMGLMQQRQIDYTRSNESEADRLGIQSLARAGYQPLAMADFFNRMQRSTRGNSGGYNAPEFLRTHPVTTTRVSEAKDRAAKVAHDYQTRLGTPVTTPLNPLLPNLVGGAISGGTLAPGDHDNGLFAWARERLRVLSAGTATAAVGEYERQRDADAGAFGDAQRYGLALARTRQGHGKAVIAELEQLSNRHPDLYWLDLARAEAEHQAGLHAVANARYDALLRRLPDNRAVALSYARALGEIGSADAGRRAQAVLRPLLGGGDNDDPAFQQAFARACEIAGDLVRAGEAYAEAAFLSGRPEDALNQLDRLTKRDDINYYERARIEARMTAMTPIVLEMRRQGLRPGDGPQEPGLAPQPAFQLRVGDGREDADDGRARDRLRAARGR